MCIMQALSPAGRCKTFDDSADGYGRGEGFALIVIRHQQASQSGALAWVQVSNAAACRPIQQAPAGHHGTENVNGCVNIDAGPGDAWCVLECSGPSLLSHRQLPRKDHHEAAGGMCCPTFLPHDPQTRMP